MNRMPEVKIIMPMRIDLIIQERELEAKAAKIGGWSKVHDLAEKQTGSRLLPCFKCGQKFLDLSAGSHICPEETGY